MQESKETIDLHTEEHQNTLSLFGTNDRNIKQIEEYLPVTIITRGGQIQISGNSDDVNVVKSLLLAVMKIIKKRHQCD